MMNNITVPPLDLNDAELVAASLSGNRDAFGGIVSRYQSLICALAYSATGNLGQSEDLAQETFLAAWKRLRDLREPEKLRSWLCGIVRNLSNHWLRRQKREPLRVAEPLEAASESAAPELPPPGQTIGKEEEAILWRSIEHIPELYREPLVLFYRENQSVAAVARNLELSEDAVKQRLSRGRKMLAEEVAAFVEGALRVSAPGRAFLFGVLAALPALATSASAATIAATTAKGGTAAKAATTLAWGGLFFGPVLGILGVWIGLKASLGHVRSEKERRLVVQFVWTIVGMGIAALIGIALMIEEFSELKTVEPSMIAAWVIGSLAVYSLVLIGVVLRFRRLQRRFQREAAGVGELEEPSGNQGPAFWAFEYQSPWTLLGLPLVHIRIGRRPTGDSRPAVGWIAVGDFAVGVLFAAGGFAVGGISMAGASLGLLSFGGLAAGGVALGGFALGGLAIGGASVGYIAVGGCAMAWQAAMGGIAVAENLALGGLAEAQHVNDAVVKTFFVPFFQHGIYWLQRVHWLMLIFLAPVGLIVGLAYHFHGRRERD